MSDKTIWYHGSPYELSVLRAGSTITQHRHLAEVFAHKPTIVCMEDDGSLRHNGELPGILYIVEGVTDDNVYLHPRSTMDAGYEWLTRSDLPLRRIGPVQAEAAEFLSEDDIRELLARSGK